MHRHLRVGGDRAEEQRQRCGDRDRDAKGAADKARVEMAQAEAAESGKKKEFGASKVRLADANKRKDNPTAEAHVFETAVSGLIKIPFKLDCTEAFKAATKVKIYGHQGFSKVKEVNVDPKKKNEGTIELNLSQAKLPAGEYPLFCSAQVKGKYKMFSEEEAKKATEDAKNVDESLKTAKTAAADAKKRVDEAKKKMDEAKVAGKAAETELVKANKDQAKAKTDWESAEKQAKEAEQKMKALLSDTSKPQPEKDAAQKDSNDKRKRANDLKLALDKITAERIKPTEQR